MENDTLILPNDFSRNNLKSLGFIQNANSKDYMMQCQYKHFKYASKKVVLIISSELDKVYVVIEVNDYDSEGVRVSKTHSTLHFRLHTISELIILARMLNKDNINF